MEEEKKWNGMDKSVSPLTFRQQQKKWEKWSEIRTNCTHTKRGIEKDVEGAGEGVKLYIFQIMRIIIGGAHWYSIFGFF